MVAPSSRYEPKHSIHSMCHLTTENLQRSDTHWWILNIRQNFLSIRSVDLYTIIGEIYCQRRLLGWKNCRLAYCRHISKCYIRLTSLNCNSDGCIIEGTVCDHGSKIRRCNRLEYIEHTRSALGHTQTRSRPLSSSNEYLYL